MIFDRRTNSSSLFDEDTGLMSHHRIGFNQCFDLFFVFMSNEVLKTGNENVIHSSVWLSGTNSFVLVSTMCFFVYPSLRQSIFLMSNKRKNKGILEK